jgi:hypothetical protein
VGRKVTDGLAVDVTAPGAQLVETWELYRIDNFTGFALDEITAAEVDRGLALDVSEAVVSCKVPAATAAARGDFLNWTTGAGFKRGSTDLQAIAAPADGSVPDLAVAQVETPRNAGGYARIKLVQR